ncbi:MAG TPA: histidine kinase [Nitrospiraceae bacterium]|jgi:two-component system nitrogen regulation sensor histidine kinase GlnL|nr:histidine kinase [Nitrospiraceae bacterium]
MKRLYTFYTDKKLNIISWGKDIADFTGESASTVLGKKYFEVLPRIFRDDRDALLTALKGKKQLTMKGYSVNCFNGQVKADIRINPLKAAGGNVEKIKVSFSPDSTCAMAKKLLSSQRYIDIGKITSTLAHGVRNPLNALKGAVVYINEKYAGEKTLLEFTKIIEDEIERLENFISRLLSTHVQDTGFSLIDINSLLKRIEILTSLQAKASNIRATYEYGDIHPIVINAFHFEQAILNVINNAIDSMRSGGQITVKTYAESRSGNGFVTIEISDTGPGIDKSKVRFQATPAERKEKGFGLSITHEILQFYDGHLEIKSKKQQGTTVKLSLPVTKAGGKQ